MAVEIEAKMRLTDLTELKGRLAAAGAREVADLLEVNTFFDTPRGSLKSADEGLRVRLEKSIDGSHVSATITHKGPRARGKIKTRDETEVTVGNARAAAELLTALGFVAVLSFEKRRNRWKLDGCNVELDTLPYLGHFVEIEGPSEQAVMDVRRKLGCEHLSMISASYISMLVDYLSEHAIRSTHVTLEEATAGA